MMFCNSMFASSRRALPTGMRFYRVLVWQEIVCGDTFSPVMNKNKIGTCPYRRRQSSLGASSKDYVVVVRDGELVDYGLRGRGFRGSRFRRLGSNQGKIPEKLI